MDDAILGLGTAPVATNPNMFLAGQHEARKITYSTSKRIYMNFDISGLLGPGNKHWIPLFALGGQGLSIQLSLAPGNQAMIISDSGNTYSSVYTLTDIRLLGDMITLNDDLQSSYNAALLNGTSLKMGIRSWEVITNYLPQDSAGNFDCAISKNYTRLATMLCLFSQNPDAQNGTKVKIVNTNYFPTAAAEGFSYALHLGSRRIPDNDVRGSSEAWYRLSTIVWPILPVWMKTVTKVIVFAWESI